MADYSSYSDTAAEPASSDPKDSEPDQEDEGTEGATFLAPKSSFGHDCKPGDVYRVEVLHSYEDELELRHLKSDGAKEPPTDDVSMKE